MSPLLLLFAPAFAADGMDGHHFTPAPGYGGALDAVQVWQIQAEHPRSFGLSALVDGSQGGLVRVTEDWEGVTETPLYDDGVALNLGARVALLPRLSLTASAPLFLSSQGPAGATGAGLGDLRLAAPVGLLLGERGPSLGLVPLLDLPTGDAAAMRGDAGLGAGGLVAAGWRGGRLRADLNVGYEQLPPITLDNQTGGGRLLASLGAGLSVTDAVGVGAELITDRALAKNAVPGTGSPTEAQLFVRGRQRFGLSWMAGIGAGLGEGAGAPTARAMGGIGFAYLDDPNRDPDLDGVTGREDACPREAEVKNGWKDLDGCPDALADLTLRVQDEEGSRPASAAVRVDGTAQELDAEASLSLTGRLPDAPLEIRVKAPGYVDAALDLPGLDEGPNARTLVLAWLPGTTRITVRDAAGAPVAATLRFQGSAELQPITLGAQGQTQLVLPGGEWQILAEAEGFGTEGRVLRVDAARAALTRVDFSLSPPKAVVAQKEVVIREAVRFDFNADTLRPDSDALLRQVAGLLLAHPELRRIEVQGHTDDVGDPAYNLDLSQRRVEVVRDWLIQHGVDGARLEAKGYGETQPLASNATEAGQAANRRVQFLILEQAAPEIQP